MKDHRACLLERVDDAAIAQVYADGFEELLPRERVLVWHLAEAALWGRDIYYDQRYRHGLEMREVLEQILRHPAGIEPGTLGEIGRYTKLFWLNSGPYNTLTARKFTLSVSPAALRAAAVAATRAGAAFPVREGEPVADLLARLEPAFFDPAVEPFVTNKNPEDGGDILAGSANNLYSGVRLADLEGFEERYPLNSRLTNGPGGLAEEACRLGGRYGAYIRRIVEHLEAARAVAPEATARALGALIEWYRSGEEAARRAYDVAWVADRESPVDTINGFIEVYLDPRGHKGSWEGVVFYVNRDKTEAVERIARHAQWFEDRMPWDPSYRRQDVQGVTGKAIDVVLETGDAGPLTPIGINLPNDQAIREAYGSKSVSLSNIFEAYERSLPQAYHAAFSWTAEEAARAERWSSVAHELCTHLHEIVGHGSGLVEPRLGGAPQTFLREHYSALEETRADLVSLYFVADRKMVELDLIPAESFDEIVRAEYEAYARNALVQLRRVRTGSRLEEDHMRNRQAIVHWLVANTTAVERRVREGRTYLVVADVPAFRLGAGRLLGEIQRIKAQGDYDAARAFFEQYGVHFDPDVRDDVVRRVDALGLPSYTGFVMPALEPVCDERGEVVDARISYPCDFTAQMLDYSSRYCLRPVPWVGPDVPPA